MSHCGTRTVPASLAHFLLSPGSLLHWVGFPQGHPWPPSWLGQCLLFCVHLTWSVSSCCFYLPLMFSQSSQALSEVSQGLVSRSFLCSLHRLSAGDLSRDHARPSAWVQMTSRSGSPAHISLFSLTSFHHPAPTPIWPFFTACFFMFLVVLHKYMSC